MLAGMEGFLGCNSARVSSSAVLRTPSVAHSWQIQFHGDIDYGLNVSVYDLDLFETPATEISRLHQRGVHVICYVDAGGWESYRDDASSFPATVLGKAMAGWPDERWIDIRHVDAIRPLLGRRLDIAKIKECDGIDPDNMGGFTNDTGFPLTANDQLVFNRMIAAEARKRGLSVGLKNDVEQVGELVHDFDWVQVESCFQYHECESYLPFVR